MKRWVLAVLATLLMASIIVMSAGANNSNVSESEPNDSSAEANSLYATDHLQGSISPSGDVDYFSMSGINTTWGFIALLDTHNSTTSTDATLTALGTDGTTVLQSDSGSWENGSGIALQNYADGNATHYLKVNETGDDSTVSDYSLVYYNTIVSTQPEVEPNETRTTGTPSSFTMSGALSSDTDVDCYQIHGRQDDSLVFALKAGSSSPADYQLTLVDPSGTPIATADQSGVGGNEFLTYSGLASDGLYAYCVSLAGGASGVDATYEVGLVRDGSLYFPAYSYYTTWDNPGSGSTAQVGDTLTFTLSFSNDSPVDIPGYINMYAEYDDTCLEFTSADVSPTSTTPGDIQWYRTVDGISAGNVATITANFQALKTCRDNLHINYTTEYYDTGVASDTGYIIGHAIYLPQVTQ